jgi:hypothetical protein
VQLKQQTSDIIEQQSIQINQSIISDINNNLEMSHSNITEEEKKLEYPLHHELNIIPEEKPEEVANKEENNDIPKITQEEIINNEEIIYHSQTIQDSQPENREISQNPLISNNNLTPTNISPNLLLNSNIPLPQTHIPVQTNPFSINNINNNYYFQHVKEVARIPSPLLTIPTNRGSLLQHETSSNTSNMATLGSKGAQIIQIGTTSRDLGLDYPNKRRTYEQNRFNIRQNQPISINREEDEKSAKHSPPKLQNNILNISNDSKQAENNNLQPSCFRIKEFSYVSSKSKSILDEESGKMSSVGRNIRKPLLFQNQKDGFPYPGTNLTLLIRYFLLGLATSVVFFGIFYCIQNIDFNKILYNSVYGKQETIPHNNSTQYILNNNTNFGQGQGNYI